MDESQKRMSGLPRPTKLPRPGSGLPRPTSSLPRPASVIRPSPSRESIGGPIGGGELRNPRLRASASQSQLRNSIGGPQDLKNTRLRASISRDQLASNTVRSSLVAPRSRPGTANAPSTPGRSSRSIVESPLKTSSESLDDPSNDDPDRPLFPRRLTLTRRPSEILSGSPVEEPPLQNLHASWDDLDSLRQSAASPTGEAPQHMLRTPSSKSQQSLAERTVETLAAISSPAGSRKSSITNDQMGPRARADSNNSRPGSSYAEDGAFRYSSRSNSRPGSSSEHLDTGVSSFRASTTTFKSALTPISGTPSSRRTSSVQPPKTPKSYATPSRGGLTSTARRVSSALPLLPAERSPSPPKKAYSNLPSKPAAKPAPAKSLKARASAKGLSKKASLPALDRSALAADAARNSPWDGTIAPVQVTKEADPSPDGKDPGAYRKSSTALREQIAKAKAAKRAAAQAPAVSNGETPIIPSDDGFDFGVNYSDPFNLRQGESPKKKVLQQRVNTARTSGRLNIAALGLKEIPVEVMKMYDLENIGALDASWAESVDLTRFVAADNELETLDDFIFPDSNPETFDEAQAMQGNIFGGLETLDMHGNLLVNVPLGLRRLPNLTSLNLSSNRLQNNCLDTIAQITSLRDLKLAKNLFFGPLNPTLANLSELEILDVHGNNISALPTKVENMSHLRILNLSENSFESLPFDGLATLPLTELNVKKNKLTGTLIDCPIDSFRQLQSLDASANQLTRIVPLGSAIDFPVLHSLSLSMNRLQGLPDMTSWTNLLTLTVDENSISGIPNSFTSLDKLRHADFSGNDIRVVPPEVSRMRNLAMLRLNGNPLRDKKFLSITTEELKDVLANRLEPPPPYHATEEQPGTMQGSADDEGAGMNHRKTPSTGLQQIDEDIVSEETFATPPTSATHSPSGLQSQNGSNVRARSQTLSNQTWPVKPGGILDRSKTESSSLHPVVASKVAAEHQVRQLHLQHNLFASLPESISFFAETMSILSLAHNQLIGETYLTENLELPALKELNLSSNRISKLSPLIKHLHAPQLEKLDVSLNRLVEIPLGLKEAFPSLSVLLAANNHLVELDPESIKGLRIVDVGNNDIAHLNPRIGLLGGPGGLERFEVMGNRFRVPRYNVLERGTESTLRWLRGRVPIAEMGAWKGAEEEPELD